jgi:hypothetical protein
MSQNFIFLKKFLYTYIIYFYRYITSKMGFGEKGIVKRSIASKLQSFIYGGKIPKDSYFSVIQSFSSSKKTVENKKVEIELDSTTQQQQ